MTLNFYLRRTTIATLAALSVSDCHGGSDEAVPLAEPSGQFFPP